MKKLKITFQKSKRTGQWRIKCDFENGNKFFTTPYQYNTRALAKKSLNSSIENFKQDRFYFL